MVAKEDTAYVPSLDISALADLRNSIERVGQLSDVLVCKQHPLNVLGGKHRAMAAGGLQNVKRKEIDVDEFAAKLCVTHDMTEAIVRVRSNVQRKVPKEETQALVLSLAMALASSEVDKEKIGQKLCSFLPFSDSYVLRLLPPEFKQRKYSRLRHSRDGAQGLDATPVELVQRHEGTKWTETSSKSKGIILQECCHCSKAFPVTRMLHICKGCATAVNE